MYTLEAAIQNAETLQKKLCKYTGSRCDCKFLDSAGRNSEMTGCCEARALIKYLTGLRVKGGAYLKSLRESKGVTLRDVEGATGVSNSLLSQIETGKVTEPSFRTMVKLAKFYEVDFDTLTKGFFGDET